MNNETPKGVFVMEILGAKSGTYEGHEYTTLTLRSGDTISKMTAVAGFDFAPFKDKGPVSVEVELREKNGYFSLRAVSVKGSSK